MDSGAISGAFSLCCIEIETFQGEREREQLCVGRVGWGVIDGALTVVHRHRGRLKRPHEWCLTGGGRGQGPTAAAGGGAG